MPKKKEEIKYFLLPPAGYEPLDEPVNPYNAEEVLKFCESLSDDKKWQQRVNRMTHNDRIL